MVKQISDKDEFDQELKKAGDKLVVVDFTATWCGPCRMIGPEFDKYSKADEFCNVVFLKVDVDDCQDIAAHYGIKAMPTFMFFRNGEKIDEFRGADKKALEATLKKHK